IFQSDRLCVVLSEITDFLRDLHLFLGVEKSGVSGEKIEAGVGGSDLILSFGQIVGRLGNFYVVITGTVEYVDAGVGPGLPAGGLVVAAAVVVAVGQSNARKEPIEASAVARLRGSHGLAGGDEARVLGRGDSGEIAPRQGGGRLL